MNRFILLIQTEVQCESTPWWARPIIPATIDTTMSREEIRAAMKAVYDAADLMTFGDHYEYAGGGKCLRFPGSDTTVSPCQMQSRRKQKDGRIVYAYDPPHVQTVDEFFARSASTVSADAEEFEQPVPDLGKAKN